MNGNPAFEAWWNELTRQGDPVRRPNLVQEAFEAGQKAGPHQPRPKHPSEMTLDEWRAARAATLSGLRGPRGAGHT